MTVDWTSFAWGATGMFVCLLALYLLACLVAREARPPFAPPAVKHAEIKNGCYWSTETGTLICAIPRIGTRLYRTTGGQYFELLRSGMGVKTWEIKPRTKSDCRLMIIAHLPADEALALLEREFEEQVPDA